MRKLKVLSSDENLGTRQIKRLNQRSEQNKIFRKLCAIYFQMSYCGLSALRAKSAALVLACVFVAALILRLHGTSPFLNTPSATTRKAFILSAQQIFCWGLRL